MTVLPIHTPYDGSAKPFTIGLKPIDGERWLETHADLPFLLAEKARLDALGRNAVFAAEPGTDTAQAEVLELLVAHLLAHHGETYRRVPGGIAVGGVAEPVDVEDENEPALLRAGRLVADDLLLMRRGPEGWRLAAGSLSFPSSWSIQADDRLHLPASHHQRGEKGAPRFAGADPAASAFIRVERQTLRKLPRSGDILFTVRIHLDPLAVLAAHPERARLAASLAGQLRALSVAELDYKGLAADRDRLAAALDKLA